MLIGVFLIYILLHFAFALAIGFWLLITAYKQENWLKQLGSVFAWIIISLAVIFSIVSSYAIIENKDDHLKYCPMHRMMKQHHGFYKEKMNKHEQMSPSMQEEKEEEHD